MPEENHAQVQPNDPRDHHKVHDQVDRHHEPGIRAVPREREQLRERLAVLQRFVIIEQEEQPRHETIGVQQ